MEHECGQLASVVAAWMHFLAMGMESCGRGAQAIMIGELPGETFGRPCGG